MAQAKNDGFPVASPRRFRLRQKDWLPFALIAPTILLLVLLVTYPFYTGIKISMFNWVLLMPADKGFIWFGNFREIFTDDNVFWGSLWRTGRWTLVAVVGQIGIGLPVALYLNMQFRGRAFTRTLALIPWVVPAPVVAIIWVYIFDGSFGVFNELLLRMGLIESYRAWLAQPFASFLVVVSAAIWWGFPFMTVMLLAALQGLPEEVNEAARIDGAGPWQRFISVTLPQIMPTILVVLLLRGLWFSHAIDFIYLITDGGPGIANHTLAVYAFKLTAIAMNVGYASALMVVLAIILLAVVSIFLRQIQRSRGYLD